MRISQLAYAQLSPAEQSAMRLDGETWPVGVSAVPLGQPLDLSTRVESTIPHFTDGLVLVGLSAAWVWGCLDSPPRTCEVARSDGSRVYISTPANVRVRDLIWLPGDIVTTRAGDVTTVVRTITDIARYETLLSPVDVTLVLARLCSRADDVADLAIARLLISEHLPYKARALARIRAANTRLALADAVDVVDRIDSTHRTQ